MSLSHTTHDDETAVFAKSGGVSVVMTVAPDETIHYDDLAGIVDELAGKLFEGVAAERGQTGNTVAADGGSRLMPERGTLVECECGRRYNAFVTDGVCPETDCDESVEWGDDR